VLPITNFTYLPNPFMAFYSYLESMSANPYPERALMTVMRITTGMSADRALQKTVIPAGRERTPAPTMDFTRLNVRLVMEALPLPASPVVEEDSSSLPSAGMLGVAVLWSRWVRLVLLWETTGDSCLGTAVTDDKIGQ